MSDTPETDQTQAEPVDAEFEPAPGSTEKPKKTKPRKTKSSGGKSLPWLTIAVVTIAASSIGGGTGWLIGRYAPDASDTRVSERLAALEAASAEPVDTSAIDALATRLATAEDQLEVAQMRSDAFEQLIRDVAALRGRVDTLETSPPATDTGPAAVDDVAILAGLERRMDEAVAELSDRLDTLSADTQAARSVADQAQVATQQALSVVAQMEARADTQARDPSANPAPAPVLTLVNSRLDALETSLAVLDSQATQLQSLQTQVAVLANADPIEVDTAAVDALADRVLALETEMMSLAEASATPDPAPITQSAGLAQRALAFATVSRAAASDEPFPVAVSELQRLWPDAPGVSQMTGPARTGAPTLDQLVSSFPGNAVRAATGEAQMWLGIIRVERDGTTGPTPGIEQALNQGDLASAVVATRALEGDAALAAATWLAEAEARLAIEEGLVALGEALSREEEGEG